MTALGMTGIMSACVQEGQQTSAIAELHPQSATGTAEGLTASTLAARRISSPGLHAGQPDHPAHPAMESGQFPTNLDAELQAAMSQPNPHVDIRSNEPAQESVFASSQDVGLAPGQAPAPLALALLRLPVQPDQPDSQSYQRLEDQSQPQHDSAGSAPSGSGAVGAVSEALPGTASQSVTFATHTASAANTSNSKPAVRRTVYSSIQSLGANVQIASPTLGFVKHRSKKHATIVLSPNHLIHVPRTFLQEHFNVEDVLKNGLRVQIDADGILDPDIVETTVANYQNKSGYSYHRLLGFKPVCRKYLNWKVIGWQAVDERTVRLCISAPEAARPAAADDISPAPPLLDSVEGLGDYMEDYAAEAPRPSKVRKGAASAFNARLGNHTGGAHHPSQHAGNRAAHDVTGFTSGCLAVSNVATGAAGTTISSGNAAEDADAAPAPVYSLPWGAATNNVMFLSTLNHASPSSADLPQYLPPQSHAAPDAAPHSDQDASGIGRTRLTLDSTSGLLQQVLTTTDPAPFFQRQQAQPSQPVAAASSLEVTDVVPPAPGTAYIACSSSGQVVAVVNSGVGALCIPIVQPPSLQLRQQQELVLQALAQQQLPQLPLPTAHLGAPVQAMHHGMGQAPAHMVPTLMQVQQQLQPMQQVTMPQAMDLRQLQPMPHMPAPPTQPPRDPASQLQAMQVNNESVGGGMNFVVYAVQHEQQQMQQQIQQQLQHQLQSVHPQQQHQLQSVHPQQQTMPTFVLAAGNQMDSKGTWAAAEAQQTLYNLSQSTNLAASGPPGVDLDTAVPVQPVSWGVLARSAHDGSGQPSRHSHSSGTA